MMMVCVLNSTPNPTKKFVYLVIFPMKALVLPSPFIKIQNKKKIISSLCVHCTAFAFDGKQASREYENQFYESTN